MLPKKAPKLGIQDKKHRVSRASVEDVSAPASTPYQR